MALPKGDLILFLYSTPTWTMDTVIVFTTLLIALDGCVLSRRILPVTFDAEQRNMTIAMMTAVTTINSLLVAFPAISVWGAYQATTNIVAVEAAYTMEPTRDLSTFSHPGTTTVRSELITYLQHVVHDKWPSMQQHAHPDANTEAAFDITFAAANRITPRDDRERMLLVEVLTRVNEMVRYREKRPQGLEATMPGALRGVMLIASSPSLLLFYALPTTRFHMALVAVWVTTLGLVFFFVLAVGRPFVGKVGVSAAPLEHAIQVLSNDKPQAHPGLD